MLRIVLNPEILSAALCCASGASHALLNEAAYMRVCLLITAPLIAEYHYTLQSPAERLAHGRTEEAMDRFLAAVAAAGEPVITDLQWRPRVPDALDDIVLQAGVMGRADAVVTLRPNRFSNAAALGLRVLTPTEMLMRIR